MKKIKSSDPVSYVITDIRKLTHDTSAFTFKLPENSALDFLPGDHMMVHAKIDGKDVVKPYTPSSTPDDTGFFEMIIKRYPDGLISGYVHDKKIDDELLISGPTPGGHFEQGMAKNVCMIAGGAGVTPMISIIRTALRRNYDVNMLLLFANKTEADIILHDEFEEHARKFDNFDSVFVLGTPPDNWSGLSGHIDENMLRQHLPSPTENSLIFLCGPPMMEYKLRQAILALGYDKSRLVIP